MDATTYTGNAGTNVIINQAGFKPDLVWIKLRSGSASHLLTDSVRGVTAEVGTNRSDAEQTVSNALTSFNTNGFSLGNQSFSVYYGSMNDSGSTYVGWQWQAGQGSNTTNTTGTITSTVSANATAGFSIVSFTMPNASAPQTVGHGLGAVPSFIVMKYRSQGSQWYCYHTSLGNGAEIHMNSTAALNSSSTFWNSTTPTSSVFTLGSAFVPDTSTSTMIAYCWAPVAGFSQFGSYTGNGSTDGPFIYLGFRPAYVMVKRTDSTGNWIVLDTTRSAYNYLTNDLLPNTPDAEQSPTTAWGWDMLSNGFKLRDNGTNDNANGGTYIYAAFAENPFKYANAR